MMNYIWVGLVFIAVVAGAITGTMEGVLNNIFDFASTAVDICLGLIGIMAFFCGLMKVMEDSGLCEKLGKAISLFPGKSEYWLMLRFEDNCRMWFRGYNSFPIAMVQVQLFGSAEAALTEQMTAEICRILSEELSVQPDHIYINYSFSETWGWNNENF